MNDKLEAITDAVTFALGSLCDQCQVTADNFKNKSISCSQKSSSTVIYESRISRTPQSSSSDLADSLEEWMSAKTDSQCTGSTIDSMRKLQLFREWFEHL